MLVIKVLVHFNFGPFLLGLGSFNSIEHDFVFGLIFGTGFVETRAAIAASVLVLEIMGEWAFLPPLTLALRMKFAQDLGNRQARLAISLISAVLVRFGLGILAWGFEITRGIGIMKIGPFRV